jgi:hypothetical protein
VLSFQAATHQNGAGEAHGDINDTLIGIAEDPVRQSQ